MVGALLGQSETSRTRISVLALSLAILLIGQYTAASESSVAPDSTVVPRSLLLEFLADNSTFTLIDARSSEEFTASHIAGAINVPHDAVDDALPELPTNLHAPIIIYCKTGKRAALLQTKLKILGYTDIRLLQASQIFWFDAAAVFNCGLPEAERPSGEITSMLNEDKTEEKE